MGLFASPDHIEKLFTNSDGSYRFARWGRPIVPVVFGVEENTLKTVKGAIEAIVTLAGHRMAETDPELGANQMLFFFQEWDELLAVPDLEKLIPDLPAIVARLKASDANQYRAFRFDEHGAIQAAFVFLRMSGPLGDMPAETIALTEAAQTIVVWGDSAFAKTSPLAVIPESGATILRPEISAVIAAGYDRMMPLFSDDASHAHRLFARLQGA
ncbi:hypothetical protein NBRC116601_14400 [Cognatishimia sp. WU-CL00825]|uniref:hypothetical protein n=1 Tax=Cognatishimia sp. WU-CL00825 TaxID=3127658 RepID=UPI00310AA1A8